MCKIVSNSVVSHVVDDSYGQAVVNRFRKLPTTGEFNPASFPDVAQSMVGLGLGDCYAFCKELVLTATPLERDRGFKKYLDFMKKPRPFSRSYMNGLLLRNLYFMQQRWYNLRPAERVDVLNVRAFYYEHLTFLLCLLETYFDVKDEPENFPEGFTHCNLEVQSG
jgi:hypothetical protein